MAFIFETWYLRFQDYIGYIYFVIRQLSFNCMLSTIYGIDTQIEICPQHRDMVPKA